MEERLCLGRGSRQRELAGWRLRSGVQRASEGGGQSCGVGLQEGREVPGGLLPKPCPFPSQDPLPIPGGPALTWLEFRPGSAALWEDQEYQCHLWCDCPCLLCCVLPRAVLEEQSMQGRGQQPPPTAITHVFSAVLSPCLSCSLPSPAEELCVDCSAVAAIVTSQMDRPCCQPSVSPLTCSNTCDFSPESLYVQSLNICQDLAPVSTVSSCRGSLAWPIALTIPPGLDPVLPLLSQTLQLSSFINHCA